MRLDDRTVGYLKEYRKLNAKVLEATISSEERKVMKSLHERIELILGRRVEAINSAREELGMQLAKLEDEQAAGALGGPEYESAHADLAMKIHVLEKDLQRLSELMAEPASFRQEVRGTAVGVKTLIFIVELIILAGIAYFMWATFGK